MMTRLSSSFQLLSAAMCLCVSLSSAAFANSDIVQAISDATQEELQSNEQRIQKADDANKAAIDSLKLTLTTLEADRQSREMQSAPIYELFSTLNKMPEAIVLTEQAVREVLFNRRQLLQRIALPPATRPDFFVDSSLGTSVAAQSYDIFMRYFCNPLGRGGKLKDLRTSKENVPYHGKLLKKYILRCGYVEGADIPTRATALAGDANNGIESEQIIDLPTRPDVLIFNPGTFPMQFGNVSANDMPITNTNRLAPIYLGAFEQFLLSVTGAPPKDPDNNASIAGDPSAYLAAQRDITVKMLASYPFALLFAERTGTMGPDVARFTANLLKTKLSVGTQSPQIVAQIRELEKRQSLSMSEYMSIMAYQLPTSPGYYQRINNELTSAQLKREAVWLTSLQTALNYQRNRWLEILAALEAADQRL